MIFVGVFQRVAVRLKMNWWQRVSHSLARPVQISLGFYPQRAILRSKPCDYQFDPDQTRSHLITPL